MTDEVRVKVDWVPSGGSWGDRRWVLYLDDVRAGRVIMWYDRTAVDAVNEADLTQMTFPNLRLASEWLLRDVALQVRTVPADVEQVDA